LGSFFKKLENVIAFPESYRISTTTKGSERKDFSVYLFLLHFLKYRLWTRCNAAAAGLVLAGSTSSSTKYTSVTKRKFGDNH